MIKVNHNDIHIKGLGIDIVAEFGYLSHSLVEHGIATYEMLHDFLNMAEELDKNHEGAAEEKETDESDSQAPTDELDEAIEEFLKRAKSSKVKINDLIKKIEEFEKALGGNE